MTDYGNVTEHGAGLFSVAHLRDRATRPSPATEMTSVLRSELNALLDVVETAICRRFTTIACRQRPEIDPADYCVTCKALARFEEYVDA